MSIVPVVVDTCSVVPVEEPTTDRQHAAGKDSPPLESKTVSVLDLEVCVCVCYWGFFQ